MTRRRRDDVDSKSVFINCPFEPAYEPLFLSIITGLITVGLAPRCVLELNEGQYRLDRIYALMQSCGASVHDLSRTRMNMPFELGIAYSLSKTQDHAFVILEEVKYRVIRRCSDLNGIDPQIHGGTSDGVLQAILNSFASTSRPVRMAHMRWVRHMVSKAVRMLKHDHGSRTIFNRQIFNATVVAATGTVEYLREWEDEQN